MSNKFKPEDICIVINGPFKEKLIEVGNLSPAWNDKYWCHIRDKNISFEMFSKDLIKIGVLDNPLKPVKKKKAKFKPGDICIVNEHMFHVPSQGEIVEIHKVIPKTKYNQFQWYEVLECSTNHYIPDLKIESYVKGYHIEHYKDFELTKIGEL